MSAKLPHQKMPQRTSVEYKIKAQDDDDNSTCGNADESEAFMVPGHRGIRQEASPMPRGRVQQLQGQTKTSTSDRPRFAKSRRTGCPYKSMGACHTPSTMPQTARTLNSKLRQLHTGSFQEPRSTFDVEVREASPPNRGEYDTYTEEKSKTKTKEPSSSTVPSLRSASVTQRDQVYRKPRGHRKGYVCTARDVPVTEGGAQRARRGGKSLRA